MNLNPWTWLAEKTGKLTATAIAVVSIVLAILGPFWLAYHMGWSDRDDQAKRDALERRADVLQQLLDFSDQVRGIAGDYVLRRGQGEIVYRTLKQEVPHVVTVYRSAPGAAPQHLPRCVFTRGFVRVWNAANVPVAGDPAGGGQAVEHADSADDLIAEGIDQRAVLENHVSNAELTHNDRLQCEAAIEILRKLPGGKR